MVSTDAERAERLAKARAIGAVGVGTLLAATQASRMDAGGSPAGWITAGIVITVFMLWASGLFLGRRARAVLNDESCAISRSRSLLIGFGSMLVTALICYGLTYVNDYGPRDAIQIVMSVGISSALVSFGVSESLFRR